MPSAGAEQESADGETSGKEALNEENLDKEISDEESFDGETAVVYFTSDISPEGLMAVYKALEWKPTGKVAVKLSTREPPASNYLDPELIKDLVQSVDGTIVECNTAYSGSRTEAAMHMQVAETGWFTYLTRTAKTVL